MLHVVKFGGYYTVELFDHHGNLRQAEIGIRTLARALEAAQNMMAEECLPLWYQLAVLADVKARDAGANAVN